MGAYENTELWSRALGDTDGAAAEQRDRLRVAYRKFWANAVTLSRQIQKDVPGLTLHDDTHFEALWDRADQIAGSLTLTPLEAFVFGGAILLHDNANSLAAFEGGLEALKKTAEWKDASTEWSNRQGGEDPQPLTAEGENAVLFDVLRSLHAERAKTLAGLSFNLNGKTVHLIEDDELRNHLGHVMGLVAASHHWDVTTLQDRLPPSQGALAGMPKDWTIRPVLLACLLRTADAVQLDQSRTPDFLYGLLQLKGVSELHWRGQNRLSTPMVSPRDPTSLIFSSTAPFTSDDAEAWWIAHDALKAANNELQAANALLRDLGLPPFAVNRIEGARSPKALAKHVAVSGWRPVQAEIKITQVSKVVEMFGGEQLYGKDPSVALRELIQNAADAIRMRRELEPANAGYEGRIVIRMSPVGDGTDDSWLDVEDDGLGMSEAVLTGPLIDFGSSYLSSALVKSERPGLLSKGRSRIGKFGIGFFSCFMAADEVLVTSHPFDTGKDQFRTLHFRDGLGHRPLLLEEQPAGLSALVSTRVRLRLTPEQREELLTAEKLDHSFTVTLSQLVGMLCPMLNVDVHVEFDNNFTHVHSQFWTNEDRFTWLNRITAAEAEHSPAKREVLESAAPRLRFFDDSNPNLGLACIISDDYCGASTVGTLRAGNSPHEFGVGFAGTIDHTPADPRRGRGYRRASHECVSKWASHQAELIAQSEKDLHELIYLSERVADFGGDATPIARFKINGHWRGLEEILDFAICNGPLFAHTSNGFNENGPNYIGTINKRFNRSTNKLRPSEIGYTANCIETESQNCRLYAISDENNNIGNGFSELLSAIALKKGFKVQTEFIDRIEFARYTGEDSPRENLKKGMLIGGQGVKISLAPIST